MKRTIQALVLLLMLVTSLNAGTLAVYTSRVDLAPVTVAAKRFALGVNQGGQGEFDLKIGPGELVSYQFDVTNQTTDGHVSEVDMDVMIQADFSAILQSIPNMVVRLTRLGSAGDVTVAQADASGTLTYEGSRFFLADVGAEASFALTFYWDDGNGATSLPDGSRMTLPLTVYVKGVQHVA